jgi:hypothetical protein
MHEMIMMKGTPDDHNLALEQIEPGLYGLTYTGFWGCKAWCYVAVGPDAAVFCQPLNIENGASGTSITNIWNSKFILAVAALAPIGHRPLYEYYFDDKPPDISRVTWRDNDVSWKYTGQSFAQIVGRPEPDWNNLNWGHEAAARCGQISKIRARRKKKSGDADTLPGSARGSRRNK